MGEETWNSPDVTNLTGHTAGIQFGILNHGQCAHPPSPVLWDWQDKPSKHKHWAVYWLKFQEHVLHRYKYLADFLQQDNHRRPVLTHSAPSPHTSEASAGVPRPFTLPYHRGGGLKLDFRRCSHHALQNATSLWATLLRVPRLGTTESFPNNILYFSKQQGKQLWVASSGNLSNLIYCFCKKILLS